MYKMRSRLISVSIILILFVSLCLAEEVVHGSSATLKQEAGFAVINGQNIEDKSLHDDELEMFRGIDNKGLLKVMSLNEEKIFKLAELDKDNIQKLSRLDTRNLRKISSLDTSDLILISNLSEEQLQKLSSLNRANLISYLHKPNITKELDDLVLKAVDTGSYVNKRLISEQKIRSSEERFQKAEQNLLKLKTGLDNEMNLLLLAESDKDVERIKEHSRKYIYDAAFAIINYLEKIKSRIEQSPDLRKEESEELINSINLQVQDLEDIMYDSEENLELDEVRYLAKNLNALWKIIRIESEFYVISLVNSKIDNIIKESEILEAKLEKILFDMENKGIGMDSLDKMLFTFSQSVFDARKNLAESDNMCSSARSSGMKNEVESFIVESKFYSSKAKNSLSDSYAILKDIIKEIKLLDGSIGFQDEPEKIIVLEDKPSKDPVSVLIEGFIEKKQKKIIDSLVDSLSGSGSEVFIDIEVKSEGSSLELKKEVKGKPTDNENKLINELVSDLEKIGGTVKIKIMSGDIR